jgi:hypothetical protein
MRRAIQAVGAVAIVALVSFGIAVALSVPSREWTETETRLIGIILALDDYHADHGLWPSPEDGLDALLQGPPAERRGRRFIWDNHYLQPQDLNDAWGRRIGYAVTREGCVVFSLGGDHESGGSGEAADILVPCGDIPNGTERLRVPQ